MLAVGELNAFGGRQVPMLLDGACEWHSNLRQLMWKPAELVAQKRRQNRSLAGASC